ncbi:glycosyltransferase [Pseudomonas cichorii]|nr:glycosyltransferase [Pseudomonas cichorii]MBX8539434.1 glycosyltransferase [Pseudomonas cichorii]MBX8547362.1 glycosyltransferase [Pseudomonas cichorii]MBX8561082.1 glycosyltransferase [Pseudomonas cichorii]MBX8564861.1 glycosyltransferase [Pseudomonas cichorii]MBX8579362.1 glycosyltransferase [Pseudomonas cichorii]
MHAESDMTQRSVLMLCNDRQIDRRILLQADSLQEAGWQVRILAMPLDEPVKDDPRVSRVGQASSPQVAIRETWVLSIYRFIRRYLSMNGGPMRMLKTLAWRFLVDQEKFYLRLFLDSARQMRADVVVAHDLPMLALGRTLAAEFSARLVYDSHELYCEQEFSRAQGRSWALIEQRHIGACDLVITVNPSIAKELEQRYGLKDVQVIHNAERVLPLGTRSWYLHDCFNIPHSHLILLFQGGLSAGRHLPELINAMLLVKLKTVHLVLLGDGQLGSALCAQIKRLGLEQRVHLHAAVPQSDLLAITASADAGVIPYQAICLNNFYCTPNKLFEFIAAGLPILASDLPELRRIVSETGIGQVTDLSSVSSMAEGIDNFFQDHDQLQEWRDNLSNVREQFSWQVEGARLKVMYERFQ